MPLVATVINGEHATPAQPYDPLEPAVRPAANKDTSYNPRDCFPVRNCEQFAPIINLQSFSPTSSAESCSNCTSPRSSSSYQAYHSANPNLTTSTSKLERSSLDAHTAQSIRHQRGHQRGHDPSTIESEPEIINTCSECQPDEPAEWSPIHEIPFEEPAWNVLGRDTGFVERERYPRRMASWVGQPRIKGSTEVIRMVLLTLTLVGVSFTWGIEMTYCTPYLLSLGLTKSRTSLVWIAGPLSGLIMQPIVGVLADRSRSKYGRRRPFMLCGSVVVAACLFVMAWTKEVVGFFIADKEAAKTPTIVLAVTSIYAVDFAINAVQSCARSLIVDTLPIPKQQTGSAWASRMGAMGHVVGYGAGSVDLVSILGPTLGDTQFKQLTFISAVTLVIFTGVTCWAVTERVLLSPKDGTEKQDGIVQIIKRIINTTMHLPPRIQAICWAQFWSWIGWFPFLFYSSTWVGETYLRYDAPQDEKQSSDALGDVGRIGSMALVIFSIVTSAGAIILPILIKAPAKVEQRFTPRPPSSIAGLVLKLEKYRPDLLTAWFYGHLLFSSAMFLAPMASSFRFATALVSICGISWVIATMAPFTYLGIEVNRLSHGSDSATSFRRLSNDMELDPVPSSLLLEHGPEERDGSTGELSGIYFGILNIYTTLPQFVATFISTIVFAVLEPGKSPELATDAHPDEHHSTDGANAISVCLLIGAISMLGAAYATRKLRKLMQLK